MENNFQKMVTRALEIKAKYNKIEPKEWGVEQDLMGMYKDIGDLSKILMVVNGYRDSYNKDVKSSLEHELIDIFWSIIVIADKTGIDLEKGFWKNMDKIDNKIN